MLLVATDNFLFFSWAESEISGDFLKAFCTSIWLTAFNMHADTCMLLAGSLLAIYTIKHYAETG